MVGKGTINESHIDSDYDNYIIMDPIRINP